MSRRAIAGTALVGVGLWHAIEAARVTMYLRGQENKPADWLWLPSAAQLGVCLVGVLAGAVLISRTTAETDPAVVDPWDVARIWVGTLAVVNAVAGLVWHFVFVSKLYSDSPLADTREAIGEVHAAPLALFALTAAFGGVLLFGPARVGRWFVRTFSGVSSDGARGDVPPSA